jgi:hypothetical protein
VDSALVAAGEGIALCQEVGEREGDRNDEEEGESHTKIS